MAITTLDQLVAGMLPVEDVMKVAFTGELIGALHSSWYLAGLPGASPAPAMGVNGILMTRGLAASAGQIPFPATDGAKNVYLTRFEATQGAGIGGITICDRIWMNSGLALATTTAQAISQPTLDRDAFFDGSYTGVGVQAGIEVHTAALNNAAVSNTTLQYTNSDGVAGRTGTLLNTFNSSGAVGYFVPFALQAGDKGIRSIQSVTLGTTYGTTGGISLVMYRQGAAIGTPTPNVTNDRDGISLGLPRWHNESVPFFLFNLFATAAGVTDCGIGWAQG